MKGTIEWFVQNKCVKGCEYKICASNPKTSIAPFKDMVTLFISGKERFIVEGVFRGILDLIINSYLEKFIGTTLAF